MSSPARPTIASFREHLRGLLTGAGDRPLVVLAVDGVGYDVASAAWRHAAVDPWDSVFPTTSSSAWLTSLTGLSVDDHGVPGVVFATPAGEVLDVYDHAGDLQVPDTGNVFSDAASAGRHAVCVLGDLAGYPCAWRDALLRHADVVEGCTFFTGAGPYTPPAVDEVEQRLRRALTDAMTLDGPGRPPFVWCFVELDRHIHRAGYDSGAEAYLRAVERVAVELADRGALVVAHSDHGHTPTRHDPDVAGSLDAVADRYGGAVGGAGRVRWIHAPAQRGAEVAADLARRLGDVADVADADEHFRPGGLSRPRVGDVLVIASTDRFVAPPGYTHDHGSLTPEELRVPVARWGV